jgi:hypothetical protein
MKKALHEFLDTIQRDLNACGDDVKKAEDRAIFRLLNYCPSHLGDDEPVVIRLERR